MPNLLCEPFYPSFTADLLIAFLGAFLGLVAGYLIYRISVIQSRKDRLKYVVSLIESIVPSALRQADYCEQHANLIITAPYGNQQLKLEANRDPKRLGDKVDQEGVFHAFLWKYKRKPETYKSFQNLYGYIDYIDYLVDDLLVTNEKIITAVWERKKQYKLLYSKTSELIQSFSLLPELTNTQPDLVKYGTDLLEKFADEGPKGENIKESFELVIEPLQDYIIKKAQQHPKITELLFLIQQLRNEYHGIQLAVEHNAADYKYYSEALRSTAKKLNETSMQLRNDYGSSIAKS